jgi:hypothetical protein
MSPGGKEMTSTFDESTRRITRIANAQNELLDHSGHVWAHLCVSRRRALVTEINRLRGSVAWKPLDMRGR